MGVLTEKPKYFKPIVNHWNIMQFTVKILKFGTPQTIAIIVLKLVKFDVTLHLCIQKKLVQWQTA